MSHENWCIPLRPARNIPIPAVVSHLSADCGGSDSTIAPLKRLLELGITVELDHLLYNLLITHGHVVPSKTGGKVSEDAAKLLAGTELSCLSDMFMRDQRIAQEWAGTSFLDFYSAENVPIMLIV